MRTVGPLVTAEIDKLNTRYYAQIKINGETIDAVIDDVKYTDIINNNNDIGIGQTCSKSVTFTIKNSSVDLENKEIELFEGAKTKRGIGYIQLGKFKVISAQTVSGDTNYTAYDIMATEMERGYFSNLTYPANDLSIIREICQMVGIDFYQPTDFVSHIIKEKPTGYTRREVLGYMAGLQGKNATIDSLGRLSFRWYKETDYILDGNRIYQEGLSLTSEKSFMIQRLSCNVTKGDATNEIIQGNYNGTGITFENPYITQEILSSIFDRVYKFEYQPMSVEFLGDYRLETGDIITLISGDKTYKVPIMQVEHECDGGLISRIKTIAKSDTDNSINPTGSSIQRVQRVAAELAIVNNALVNKLDAESARITYATIENLQTTNAEITDLKSSQITTDYLKSNFAEIDLANIKSGSVKTAMIDTGAVNTAQIADGSITDAKIVGLTANKITAGTLDAGVIDVVNLNAANITTGTINGKQIENLAITNEKIAQNAISADKILIGDFANLVTANENFPTSVSDVMTYIDHTGAALQDGYIVKTSATKNALALSPSRPLNFQVGETLHYNMSIKADAETEIAILINTGENMKKYVGGTASQHIIIGPEEQTITGIITLKDFGTATDYCIRIRDYTATSQIYVRKAIIRRQTSNTYIANGAITTDKIVSNAITSEKIASKTITANEIASNSITASEMNVSSLSAISANLGMVTAGTIRSSNYKTDGTIGCNWSLSSNTFKSPNMSWNSQGDLIARSAKVSGDITADSGKIGKWEILPSGGLMAETSTGTTPGTLNRVFLQPISKANYDDTWVISSQHWDIDSAGKQSATGKAYWRITGGGDFWTSGDIECGDIKCRDIKCGEFKASKIKATDGFSGSVIADGVLRTKSSSYPNVIGNGDVLQLSFENQSTSGVIIEPYFFRPASDTSYMNLGASNYRWNSIYARNSAISTSDRNQKNTIQALPIEKVKPFIMGLNPSSYKFNDADSGRTHYGLIAQDVEQLISDLEMSSMDFAGFIKSPTEDGNYTYGLRYEEFISPMIKMLQEHEKQIVQLRNELEEAKKTIEELRGVKHGSI